MGSSSASSRVYLRRSLRGFFRLRDRRAGGTARLGALEGQGLALKERATYDRMIAHQRDEHRRGARCWNPSSLARPHRLAFAFRDDDGLNLDAEHLALVCPGERPLRLVGRGPSEQRGVPGPGAVLTTSASSASCARPVYRSSTRSRAGSRFGECVSFAELQAITDLTLKQITSLFGRYSSALSGLVARRRC